MVMLIPWNGVNFHMAAVLGEAGLGPSAVALVYAPMAVAGAAAAPLAGRAIDLARGGRKLLALAANATAKKTEVAGPPAEGVAADRCRHSSWWAIVGWC